MYIKGPVFNRWWQRQISSLRCVFSDTGVTPAGSGMIDA